MCPIERTIFHGVANYRGIALGAMASASTRSAVKVRRSCIAEKNPDSAVQVAGGGTSLLAQEGTGTVGFADDPPRLWSRMASSLQSRRERARNGCSIEVNLLLK
jgi:hypothetical protein